MSLGGGNATTRFHQRNCWFSDRLAAYGTRAAGRTHAAHRRTDEYRGGLSGSAGFGRSILSRIRRSGLDGRNARIDYRWYQGNAEAARAYAAELLALTPDIIQASGTQGTIALKQLTRAVPIVFAIVADPVGTGIVDNLARPGGNITGFMLYEYSIGGKYLDLLREIAPHTTRVAVFRDDTNTASVAIFSVIQAMATSVGLQVRPVNVRNSDEIASAVEAFAHNPNGGAIVTGTALTTAHRELIVKLIERYKLPAIYSTASSSRMAA